ncbi:hypothetical protein C0J52_02658 [Blattella germanica]|nr:hypothetical protein C0J52_02658 [Blattella germanica]
MIDPVTRFVRYVATETPKRDRRDYMDLRVDVTHSLLNSTVTEDDSDHDQTVFERLPQKRKALTHDILRKKQNLHMPEIPENVKPSSGMCRIMSSIICKVFLCLNAN